MTFRFRTALLSKRPTSVITVNRIHGHPCIHFCRDPMDPATSMNPQDAYIPLNDLSEALRLVRYAARRKLPIQAWSVCDHPRLPFAPEPLGRWLAQIAGASHVPISLLPTPLDPRRTRHLLAHCRRWGCKPVAEPLSR